MSEDALAALRAAVEHDSDLRARIEATESAEDVLEIAAAAGYAIAMEDLFRASDMLTDAQLADVTGGFSLYQVSINSCPPPPMQPTMVVCPPA